MKDSREYDLKEENRRIRVFRFLTDLTLQRLSVERLSAAEAYGIVGGLRQVAEAFFPGKAGVFDLVIAPRLERVIDERFFPGESL
jgi:hypothetical protein